MVATFVDILHLEIEFSFVFFVNFFIRSFIIIVLCVVHGSFLLDFIHPVEKCLMYY